MTTQTSKKYSINWQDVLMGLLMAVVSPVFTIIYDTIKAGSLTFNWQHIGVVALSAALGYLKIKFFTPSQTIIKN